jgi:hypothetical protein
MFLLSYFVLPCSKSQALFLFFSRSLSKTVSEDASYHCTFSSSPSKVHFFMKNIGSTGGITKI